MSIYFLSTLFHYHHLLFVSALSWFLLKLTHLYLYCYFGLFFSLLNWICLILMKTFIISHNVFGLVFSRGAVLFMCFLSFIWYSLANYQKKKIIWSTVDMWPGFLNSTRLFYLWIFYSTDVLSNLLIILITYCPQSLRDSMRFRIKVQYQNLLLLYSYFHISILV